jgi:hypothetical protein
MSQKRENFVSDLKMSCRIDRVVGSDGIVVLGISGRITGQDVDTLRNEIEAESGAVAIDLENVDLVDREVVNFLAKREINGTLLRNCSAYIREWVTRERTEVIKKSEDVDNA